MENYQSNESNQIETFNQPTANEHSEFATPTPAANPSPAADAAQTADAPTIAESEPSAAIVPAPVLYDATATQRFPFSIKEDGELLETAHIFKPIDDERHLRYIEGFVKIRDGERTDKTLTELSVDLWRDLIDSIENLEVEDGADFRDVPDPEEEISPLLISYLAVVVKPPTVAEKRQRSPIKAKNQTIITQAYFSGLPVENRHVLQAKSNEWRKKYSRLQRAQYVEDKTKGKDGEKIKFVPGNRAKAALYDEMLIEAHGFKDGVIPMRFKVVAIDAAFESSVLDAKK